MGLLKDRLEQNNAGGMRQRAALLYEDLKLEATNHVNNLKKQLRELELKELSLTDVGPENTFSLTPGNSNLKKDTWFSDLIMLDMDRKLLKEELKSAQELYEKWFGDDEANKDISG